MVTVSLSQLVGVTGHSVAVTAGQCCWSQCRWSQLVQCRWSQMWVVTVSLAHSWSGVAGPRGDPEPWSTVQALRTAGPSVDWLPQSPPPHLQMSPQSMDGDMTVPQSFWLHVQGAAPLAPLREGHPRRVLRKPWAEEQC